MGHESIIYGVILGPQWRRSDPWVLQQHNRTILESLPETDTWPFLTRAMFSVAGETPESGHYRSQAIHFGATLKSVEWEWDQWLSKFEALLARLHWDEVRLHLRTEQTVGNYDYSYEPLDRFHHLTQDPPIPCREWRFQGGPRTFGQEGPYREEDQTRVWRFADGEWSPESSTLNQDAAG